MCRFPVSTRGILSPSQSVGCHRPEAQCHLPSASLVCPLPLWYVLCHSGMSSTLQPCSEVWRVSALEIPTPTGYKPLEPAHSVLIDSSISERGTEAHLKEHGALWHCFALRLVMVVIFSKWFKDIFSSPSLLRVYLILKKILSLDSHDKNNNTVKLLLNFSILLNDNM